MTAPRASAPRTGAARSSPQLELGANLRRTAITGQQLDQRPDAEAARALRRVRVVLLAASGTGDVEVSPRHVADELFEEEAGGERSAVAVAAGVADVGHLRVDQLSVRVGQRQRPHLFTRPRGGVADL